MDAAILDGISHIGSSVGSEKKCPDDDFVDRANHTYTMNLLMFFIAVVLSRQLVGKPISCWIPNDFTGAQGEYAETVCWVTSTYFIAPTQATVPIQKDLRYEKTIYYYQWVPFILMVQAALFVFPCIIWRLFNSHTRINLRTVMDVSGELKNPIESVDQRRDLINCLVRHLEDALAIRHFGRQRRQRQPRPVNQSAYGKAWDSSVEPSATRFPTPVVPLTFSHQTRLPGPRPCNPASSSYLCGLYLVVKSLYLVNSTAQLYVTGKYLHEDGFLFGINTLVDLLSTRLWDHTGSFPRVALCDFELRRMGSNQHRYTIQCVLRVNIFNEKIYIFLWFWFLLMSAVNLLSLLKWTYRILFKSVRLAFVRNLICIYLNISMTARKHFDLKSGRTKNKDSQKFAEDTELTMADCFKTQAEKAQSKSFVEDILGQDGVLLLRFVSMNVGPAAAAEIAGVFWTKYGKSVNPDVFCRLGMTAGNTTGTTSPPVPPKRSTIGSTRQKPEGESGAFIPLINLDSKTHAVAIDSDRSSSSSRPTVENLNRRKRRHYHRRKSSVSYDQYSPAPDQTDQYFYDQYPEEQQVENDLDDILK
nr:unnamed protein product [Spirometra erinaceieuropaei]